MDSHYHVRRAVPADLPHLPEIERCAARLFIDYGFSEDDLQHVTSVEEHAQAQQSGCLWIAADQHEIPAAFIKVSSFDDFVHINEVDVHPDHQRRGLGAALIEAVCAWAASTGTRAVTLTTEREIPWNAPYYARLGFRIVPPEEQSPDLHILFEHEAVLSNRSLENRVAMIREL
ncbi:MAG: GNAT family N-acetyltransferase [Chloroflexi bacterium]|nr:GNAT family N-acetyltransferase [Chloroflexota bacterium]